MDTTAHDSAADDRGDDPREALDALAASVEPYLLGIRHHSPALAAALPALLDASGADVVCVELPADFQPWLTHLADRGTVAPVALAGADPDGRLGFYPFADFSPELAAVRWARDHGVEVRCCDLPLSDPGWRAPGPDAAPDADPDAGPDGGPDGGSGRGLPGPAFAAALGSSGTGREGDDLWDRTVEVRAPGCEPEAVRRAALGVGWALRHDASARGGVASSDLAREEHMRRVIAEAAGGTRRVAAVVGAFHAPALAAPRGEPRADTGESDRANGGTDNAGAATSGPLTAAGRGATPGPSSKAGGAGAGDAVTAPVTSLVPYTFALLDSRSGYPAGIRDPRWQQAVFTAGGVPERVRDAAATAITGLCRTMRSAGHTAGTGEAVETLRLADDLARLRSLPAPGRGELLEAVTTVLGQGEPLGRGRALARALETVLVGTDRGRVAPGTPRSGLGPAVEAELTALRLPGPESPEPREVRLDPLRSELDGRREVLLNRLEVCDVGYCTSGEVARTGDSAGLSTRWQAAWTPVVPARLDLVGVRGVTAAVAAAGKLRETAHAQYAEGGPTARSILTGLRDAARCDLPELVADRLAEAADVLPSSAALPELLDALDLLHSLRQGHLPGTTDDTRRAASELAVVLLEAAVRGLPGLAGSDDPQDAVALVALATRAGEHRLGLRMDDALGTLATTGSPVIQGAAAATRVLLDLDAPPAMGDRVASWIDRATGPDERRRLSGLLTGLLTAAGPLLQSAEAALTPLLDRIDALPDQGFLHRLPALRGGFDILTPADRGRLLRTVTERLGDRPDLTLSAPPELVALWTAADAAGLAALTALKLPGMGLSEEVLAEQVLPERLPSEATPDVPSQAPSELPPEVPSTGPGPARTGPVDETRRLVPADRWRLLLGRESDKLPDEARRYAYALDELYGAGRGEGSADIASGPPGADGDTGGRGRSFPTAREWAKELDALFATDVREEVLARAADAGRTEVIAELDPAHVRPSIELLTSVLSLAGGMPEQQLSKLRPLVRRLVDELAKELATRLRPTLTGLANPRPTRRSGGKLDLPRTLRANLAHTRRLDDGRTVVIPENPVFSTRTSRESDWRLILVVDVSGSMEASVIWSALTAAVLGGVPTLSTHFLTFSTEVIDLTDRVADPLSLLLEVRVGGGTHIAAGLAHARSLVTVPSRTLVVVVSDFEEGYGVGGLLGEVRALAASGVHLMGCAALDDTGAPRYSVPVAQQLVAAGMPVAALSPLALARWVGDRLRGENR
ncbi:vWA domain-containing protein [Streptomyces niveus]|uniref:vWA domain-containing protein n=1 Tax=Streptomyces niveus TaxID=193462 RepID=UPI0035DFBAFE